MEECFETRRIDTMLQLLKSVGSVTLETRWVAWWPSPDIWVTLNIDVFSLGNLEGDCFGRLVRDGVSA